jgi:hypothetical protein
VSELPADCQSSIPTATTELDPSLTEDFSLRGNDANSVKIKDNKEVRAKRPHVANVNFEASKEEASSHALGTSSVGSTPVKRYHFMLQLLLLLLSCTLLFVFSFNLLKFNF